MGVPERGADCISKTTQSGCKGFVQSAWISCIITQRCEQKCELCTGFIKNKRQLSIVGARNSQKLKYIQLKN